MIAFDTNLLLRLLLEDDETQVTRVLEILEDAHSRSEPVLITDITLCEVEWVLRSLHKVPREQILTVLTTLLADEQFTFEDRTRVVELVDLYQAGRAEISDYLIGLRSNSLGATTTYTFDRGLRDVPTFTFLAG